MKGYYSIIQYCPDLSRAEAANVGVLLFCPEAGFIQAKTSAGNDRIRRFFREYSIDLERLNAAKASFEGRVRTCAEQIKSMEQLERFIATRANEIVVTPPRPVKVVEPERDLQELFNELVGGRQSRQRTREGVADRLQTAFRDPKFQGRIEFSKKVVLPIVERQIEVPIAYRNGKLNLVRSTTLSPFASKASNSALQLAGEGELIERHGINGEEAGLIVVYGFGDAQVDGITAARIKGLFDDFRIRAVPDAGINAFVDEVDREAHT